MLEALRENWVLGGERSGHIISTDYAPTGDGIAAALMLLGPWTVATWPMPGDGETAPGLVASGGDRGGDRQGQEPVWTEVDRPNAELGQGRGGCC